MQQSYWENTSYTSPTDLLIIGSGLTGLLAAWHYSAKYPDRSIRILERGPFPFGASTRNAGFACFGSPTELLEDFVELGEDDTLSRVEKRVRGLEFYQANFNPADYDFNRFGGWEVFRNHETQIIDNVISSLDNLNQKLRPILRSDVYSVDKDINRFGAHLNPVGFCNQHEGQLNPGKLCKLIESELRRRGVELFNGVQIDDIQKGEFITLLDSNGFEWKGAQCIVATNGLSKQLLPKENIEPARGQVILSSPVPGLKWKGTFHIDRGYFYYRNVGNRLLLGGGRHLDVMGERTTERTTSTIIQDELESLMSSLLPNTEYKIDMRWSGIMAFGAENEKAPRVEALSDNLVIAARLGGMGVAIAPQVAEEAVHLLS